MTPTLLFAIAFTMAVAANLITRVWLARRQVAFVTAHQNAVPADFSDRISLADHRKAADYTQTNLRYSLLVLVIETLLLLVLTFGGLLQAIDSFWLAQLGANSPIQGLALIVSLVCIGWIIDLPFSVYRQFVIEARFGFNKMTPKLFIWDLVRQTLLAAALGLPILYAVLWLMSAMGDLWWLYVWLFWLTLNLLIMFIYPTWIAPLFNKFTPLPEGDLRTRVENLLTRSGFKAAGLFVMDGSKRSSHGNAYFTGFGKAKRIVFFDTLIEKLNPAEIEAVLAHELGHFKKHHIWKRIAVLAVMSLVLLWGLGQIMHQDWFYHGVGVDRASIAMALILFAQVLPVFFFPISPLFAKLSRNHEFEADAYAAQQTNGGDLISALVNLYRDNAATLTTDPLYSAFYDSHPPASLRIARLRGASA